MNRLTVKQAQEQGLIPKPKFKKAVKKSAAKWNVELVPGGVVFTIPENMPSLNEWKNWHWAKQAEYKQMLTNALAILLTKVGRPQYAKAKVQVIHVHRVNRRRDEDNLAPKFLLDALRGAKVIADDNAEVLQLATPVFEIDRERFRTEVYVLEVK